MTTQMTLTNRGERLGRMAMRWIAVGLLALLALGATLDAVEAKPSPGSYQNGFTGACRKHGGTPKRVGSRIVKCTLGDGTTITCDFNVDPPACTTVQALTGSVLGNVQYNHELVATYVEPASEPGTRVDAGRARVVTAELVVDDDQP